MLLLLSLFIGVLMAHDAGISCPGVHPHLRDLADKQGIWIGSMADWGNVENAADPCYGIILGREYSLITADDFYWEEVEPQPGVYNFLPWATSLDFATRNNQVIRCHNLVWQQTLPHYVNSSVPAQKLKQMLKTHVQTIVSHTKGSCYAWDVINEPTNSDGTLRQTIWYKALGGGVQYLKTILEWVHEIDGKAKLFINDYGIEPENKKSDGLYGIYKQLLGMGAPLHGVGFESHFDYTGLPDLSSISSNMKRFAALGIEIHVTELDMSLKNAQGSIADQWEKQGDFFANYLKVCLDNRPHCKNFETWDWTDRFTWLGDEEKNYTVQDCGYMFAPLPWDAWYNPKPAAYKMQSVLKNGGCSLGTCTTSSRRTVSSVRYRKRL